MPTWLAQKPKKALQTKVNEIKGREKKAIKTRDNEIKGREKKKLEIALEGRSWKNKKKMKEKLVSSWNKKQTWEDIK